MIYLTQLIYINEGQEKIFEEFESVAIPLISKYNGQLLLRIRPLENCIIANNIVTPYEIHLVKFDTQTDFDNFLQDKKRAKFLHLKEQSIKASILIQGKEIS